MFKGNNLGGFDNFTYIFTSEETEKLFDEKGLDISSTPSIGRRVKELSKQA